jgi:hypothetical protein
MAGDYKEPLALGGDPYTLQKPVGTGDNYQP